MAIAMALALTIALGVTACSGGKPDPSNYFDQTGRKDVLSGGVSIIRLNTARGPFRIWTKRTGNNPAIKVLLLHGGPGATHEYFEAVDSFFPGAAIEYYYYDQLGSGNSDQPDLPEMWDIPRFVDEVEQIRLALGLDKTNFYLFGHSWGGILAMEYALKHQDNLKGLIISNMMASIPEYNAYAKRVLMPAMDQAALKEILRLEAAGKYDDPKYMQLLIPHYYVWHILRMRYDQWPEPVKRSFAHLNPKVYVPMQGPSEMGASGKLLNWDRTADLGKISVPTLVIGAKHDTMDPEHMKKMASQVQKGRYLFCPDGSHLAMYDNQQVYFDGLIKFIKDVDAGKF